MLFARKGFDVMAAGSGAQALALAQEQQPGLIISDISMPEMDGYTLLEELRRTPGLEGVPAIALTGHAMDEDRERALAAGFSVHIAKPVDPDKLFQIIGQLTA
jgi:CheY-like chemotaxis protein